MPSMEVPVLIQIGSEQREVIVRAQFKATPGTPAYWCPVTGGHPGDPAEIDLIGWTVLSGRSVVDTVEDLMIEHVCAHYEPDTGPDPDDLRDQRIDRELMEG